MRYESKGARKLDIAWRDGATHIIITKEAVLLYERDHWIVHPELGGRLTYKSRSGQSGAGYIPERADVLVLGSFTNYWTFLSPPRPISLVRSLHGKEDAPNEGWHVYLHVHPHGDVRLASTGVLVHTEYPYVLFTENSPEAALDALRCVPEVEWRKTLVEYDRPGTGLEVYFANLRDVRPGLDPVRVLQGVRHWKLSSAVQHMRRLMDYAIPRALYHELGWLVLETSGELRAYEPTRYGYYVEIPEFRRVLDSLHEAVGPRGTVVTRVDGGWRIVEPAFSALAPRVRFLPDSEVGKDKDEAAYQNINWTPFEENCQSDSC